MKSSFYLTLGLIFALPATYAAEKPTKVLETQKVSAEPTHLTTRLQWVKFPQPQYQPKDLAQQDRSAIIRVYADQHGTITQATVQESTGLPALDQKLLKAVRAAKVKPYTKNGTALDIIGYQNFTLKYATEDAKNECSYSFRSENWLKQIKDKSVPFRYVKQPELAIDQNLLKNKDRIVKLKLKTNKQGNITQVKLTKRSGVNALDQQVISSVENAKVEVKRSYRTLWTYKPSTFNDEIHFKIGQCN